MCITARIAVSQHATSSAFAALIEFKPPPKREEGRSLLAGSSEDAGTADSRASTESANQKPQAMQDSLDGQVGSMEDPLHEGDGEDTIDPGAPWIPHFKPNMTISMVTMFEVQALRSLPAHMDAELEISEQDEKYSPVIHYQEFWQLKVDSTCRFFLACMELFSNVAAGTTPC